MQQSDAAATRKFAAIRHEYFARKPRLVPSRKNWPVFVHSPGTAAPTHVVVYVRATHLESNRNDAVSIEKNQAIVRGLRF